MVKVAEHSFDTCVSFSFFSQTLDPLVAKDGNTQVNNTNARFLIAKLSYVPLPWPHE